jgi:hypothetical protein
MWPPPTNTQYRTQDRVKNVKLVVKLVTLLMHVACSQPWGLIRCAKRVLTRVIHRPNFSFSFVEKCEFSC